MFKYFKKKKFLSQLQDCTLERVIVNVFWDQEGGVDEQLLKKELKALKGVFKPYTKISHIFPSILNYWFLNTADFDINNISPDSFLPRPSGNNQVSTALLGLCYTDRKEVFDRLKSLNLKCITLSDNPGPLTCTLSDIVEVYINQVVDQDSKLRKLDCECSEGWNCIPSVDKVLAKSIKLYCNNCDQRVRYPLTPRQHKKLMKSFYDWVLKR